MRVRRNHALGPTATSTSNTSKSYQLRASTIRKSGVASQQLNNFKYQTKPVRRSIRHKMFNPVVNGNNVQMGIRKPPHRQQPRVYHHQQQQQPPIQQQYLTQQPQTRYSASSPIKINTGFPRTPHSHQPFFSYQRQSSQPQTSTGRRAITSGPYSLNGANFQSNFNRPIISNSFLSFNEPGNNSHHGLQSQTQQQTNRHKPHYRFTPTKNKSKLLAAPYNTTQYIMHDYSKRKSSGGENMLREQFEHDLGLQMQSTGDMDISEQFQQPKRDNSGGEATSQSESDLESMPVSDELKSSRQNTDNHNSDDTSFDPVNRLSTSI